MDVSPLTPPDPQSSAPRSRRRLIITVLAGVLGVVVAYVVITGVVAYLAADQVRASIDQVRQGIDAGDVPASVDGVNAARDAAKRLDTVTAGPVWAGISAFPVVGPQVRGTKALAVSVVQMADAAAPLLQLLDADANDAWRTADGRINLAQLPTIATALTATAQAVEQAQSRLQPVADIGGPVGAQAGEAVDVLPVVARRLDQGAQAIQVLPGLLGANGPRTWAVLLQNAAEMRGSGGLVGAYALLTIDDGRVELIEAQARKNGLDGSVIPYRDIADDGSIQAWGSDLSRWSDYNLSMHFPLTARLTQAGFAEQGVDVDVVAALDARVVAAVLAGTGSVSGAGLTVDAQTAENLFTADIYALLPDVGDKDDAAVILLEETLQAALTRPLDLLSLARTAIDPVSQGRLKLWSANPDEEAWLATTPLGGVLPDEPGPFVGIVVNNSAGSKLDRYLTMEAIYRIRTCPVDNISSLHITVTNTAPPNLPDYVTIRLDEPDAPVGSTSILLHAYGPQDALVLNSRLDGQRTTVARGEERGHPTWGIRMDLSPGQTRTWVVRFLDPNIPDATPQMILPPLIQQPFGAIRTQPASPGECFD